MHPNETKPPFSSPIKLHTIKKTVSKRNLATLYHKDISLLAVYFRVNIFLCVTYEYEIRCKQINIVPVGSPLAQYCDAVHIFEVEQEKNNTDTPKAK